MIRRIFTYTGDYLRYVILSPILVVLETAGELILPLLMAKIIDDGIMVGNMNVVYRMGVYMIIMAIFSIFFGAFGAKAGAYGSIGIGANLRKAEFDSISRFSFADIDYFSSASLITRLTNDITNIQNFVMMMIRMLFRTLAQIVVSLVVLFYLKWQLALILVAAIPVIGAAIGILMYKCHPLFQTMQNKIDAMNEKVQENLVGIRVVKAYVREEHEEEKFQTANDEFTHAGLKAVLTIILQTPIMMIGITIVTALVLYFGGHMVLGGTLEVGNLSSIVTYIFNIMMSVMMLAMVLLQYVRASACAGRIFEVIDTKPAIQDGDGQASETTAPKGKVEFRNVRFKYQAAGSGDDVLSDINFVAQPGQVVAIVGGTGTGKSSLVNLIPRFYDVTGGSVLLDDIDVREYPVEDLRQRIGMVLQNNVLFSGTIRENLLWGDGNATEEEIIQAAKDAQAYDFIMSFPDGFDTHLEQGGVNVSGGQKQRLCIARAMLRKPEVLILDDSTSAVDSATEALIRQSFRENLRNTTVIIIAQRISSVREADQILVLDDGVIAGQGTHEQLMENNEIYQEIYWSQQEGVDG
ncbi:MAG: ABC transporter ATP-binding protein/permease [Oscillospiraceae bacterium]|nr:ABC transporter ATP-binding protein/permease [Oscillospiraceae bacterium]